MAATARVRVRMEPGLKAEATHILNEIGLTQSAAVRMLFRRVVAENAFPRELLVPNETTLAAMRETNLRSAATVDEFFAELNANDDDDVGVARS